MLNYKRLIEIMKTKLTLNYKNKTYFKLQKQLILNYNGILISNQQKAKLFLNYKSN